MTSKDVMRAVSDAIKGWENGIETAEIAVLAVSRILEDAGIF